jgi:hypothetical protein
MTTRISTDGHSLDAQIAALSSVTLDTKTRGSLKCQQRIAGDRPEQSVPQPSGLSGVGTFLSNSPPARLGVRFRSIAVVDG